MKYIIDELLNKELEELFQKHEDTDSIFFWKDFYDYIIKAYQTKNRHGLSSLSIFLKSRNVTNSQQILNVYGHGLFLVARINNEEIYGDGFCV
ncbi:hypothetical protein JDW15_06620 [Aerococcaceae bacterium zg-ZJ1578]|uniref:hypothetical protein n=1 Tax=Aerococcaceae bacterium zg-252 TaxID=2796928 RepID=UPI001A31A572|nr:hypothetical protein [Aerococcaceae bacterium zg-1578]